MRSMKWTKEPPKEFGWYWHRFTADALAFSKEPPTIIKVTKATPLMVDGVPFCNEEWSDCRIPEPE